MTSLWLLLMVGPKQTAGKPGCRQGGIATLACGLEKRPVTQESLRHGLLVSPWIAPRRLDRHGGREKVVPPGAGLAYLCPWPRRGMRISRRSIVLAVVITSLILFLIGLALGGGGVWLAMLGGSWYYVITGLAFLIAAWLLFRRKSTALWLYAAIVLGTLAWAVWEIGFDWWELGPRGGIIV